MIDQNQVPPAVTQHILADSRLVANEHVEHRHPQYVPLPLDAVPAFWHGRIRRVDDVLDPLLSAATGALDPPFNSRRHHVQPEEFVQLVGGDLGLIVFAESLASSPCTRHEGSPYRAGDGSTRLEGAAGSAVLREPF